MSTEKLMPRDKAFKLAADAVIEAMRKNGLQWSKPWIASVTKAGDPMSIHGNAYQGINKLVLGILQSSGGYESNTWITAAQIKKLGGRICKGETGAPVFLYKVANKKFTNDAGEEESFAYKMVKHFYVWNVEQTTLDLSDGLTDDERDAIKEDMQQSWNDHETAEILLQSIPAKIEHRDGNEAFYSPVEDAITMPMREQFKGAREYYGTMFHELIHWTGHRTRLDRLKLTTFGTDTYAQEELVAELGAAMICVDCRIDHERDEAHNMQHAAYLKSWMRMLKDKPTILLSAAAKAQAAANHLYQWLDADDAQEAA